MPLWLGAKEQPRYSPNRAWWTAMKTSALTGGRSRKTNAR